MYKEEKECNPISDNIASSHNPSAGQHQELLAAPPGPVPRSSTGVVPPTRGMFKVARQYNSILDNLVDNQGASDQDSE